MQLIDKIFIRHPRSVGESYLQHFSFAAKTGLTLLYAGLAALIHALIPKFHETTASETICALNKRIEAQRRKDNTNG